MIRALTIAAFAVSALAAALAQTAPGVVLPGTIQAALGGSAWDPNGETTRMSLVSPGVYELVVALPSGNYEYKVAVGGSWDENYGRDGQPGGQNIGLVVPADGTVVRFVFDAAARTIQDSINHPDVVRAPASAPPGAPPATAAAAPPAQQAPATAAQPAAAPAGDTTRLVVHYRRFDGNYAGWNLWVWPYRPQAGEGKAFTFTGRDDYGVTAEVIVPGRPTELGLIVRRNEWEAKDVSEDRFVSVPAGGSQEIWLLEGEPRIATSRADVDLSPKIQGAFLDASDTIRAFSAQPLDTRAAAGKVRVTLDGRDLPIAELRPAPGDASPARRIEIRLAQPLGLDDVSRPIVLAVEGYSPAVVYAREALSERPYWYSGNDLGSRWTPDATTFKVWSPVSSRADLLLYDGPAGKVARIVPMTRQAAGTWSARVTGDLHGTYYQYRFRSYGEDRIAADINGFAASADSSRTMVVDLARTNPAGWAADRPPPLARPTDAVIYQLHVRDFTIDPSSGVRPEWRGKYLGLVEKGTRAPGTSLPTGLDYLAGLGVTDVHLMPVQDANPANLERYNWGYETTLFNVPEQQYSTTPSDPVNTIRELKTMIAGLHSAGLRAVLDVVYNHTVPAGGAASAFWQTVPYYYFRTDDKGALLNESGVGNAMNDERPMVRKYIRDSVLYWVREYRVDGFRFDLLGMFTKATVVDLERAARAVRPDLTLYGEPWSGGGPVRFAKGAQKGTRVAVFNDNYRSALRGSFDSSFRDTATGGFAQGGPVNLNLVKRGLTGSIAYGGPIEDFTDSPIETINYISAHDNMSLRDRVDLALPDAPADLRERSVRLAGAAVLLAQGIPFLEGGAELGRTKGGNHNSYSAGDSVNRFDWARAAEYRDTVAYYRGLIAIRTANPAFRLDNADAVRQSLTFLPDTSLSNAAVGFAVDADAGPWRRTLVILNGSASAGQARLPAGTWTLLADGKRAGTTSLGTASGTLELEPLSAYVLYQN